MAQSEVRNRVGHSRNRRLEGGSSDCQENINSRRHLVVHCLSADRFSNWPREYTSGRSALPSNYSHTKRVSKTSSMDVHVGDEVSKARAVTSRSEGGIDASGWSFSSISSDLLGSSDQSKPRRCVRAGRAVYCDVHGFLGSLRPSSYRLRTIECGQEFSSASATGPCKSHCAVARISCRYPASRLRRRCDSQTIPTTHTDHTR
jgi:hypothetical protein